MKEIAFLPAAEEEFLEWLARSEGEVRGLGGEFLEEVERALERIATFLEHGSPHLTNARRVVLQRFPFSSLWSTRFCGRACSWWPWHTIAVGPATGGTGSERCNPT